MIHICIITPRYDSPYTWLLYCLITENVIVFSESWTYEKPITRALNPQFVIADLRHRLTHIIFLPFNNNKLYRSKYRPVKYDTIHTACKVLLQANQTKLQTALMGPFVWPIEGHSDPLIAQHCQHSKGPFGWYKVSDLTKVTWCKVKVRDPRSYAMTLESRWPWEPQISRSLRGWEPHMPSNRLRPFQSQTIKERLLLLR